MTVNDKVVCIDGKFDDAAKALIPNIPVEGKTYVIRHVSLGLTTRIAGQPRQSKTKLLLVGLINPCANDGKEHGFNAERFRKLDEMRSHTVKVDNLDCIGVDDGDVRIYEPNTNK